MNKHRVDNYIPRAYEAIKEIGILKDGKIPKGFRGQIASLGAMVAMGSVLSAIALYSNQGDSVVDRKKLIQAIEFLILDEKKKDGNALFFFVQKEIGKQKENAIKENILDAAIAIKLAMNLYEIEK